MPEKETNKTTQVEKPADVPWELWDDGDDTLYGQEDPRYAAERQALRARGMLVNPEDATR